MQLCRFNDNRLGLVEGDRVKDVTAALNILPASHYPLPTYDLMIANLPAVRAEVEKLAKDAKVLALADVALLSPVANPGKIVAAPVNYKKHLEEARPIRRCITRTRSPRSSASACSSRRPVRSSAPAKTSSSAIRIAAPTTRSNSSPSSAPNATA